MSRDVNRRRAEVEELAGNQLWVGEADFDIVVFLGRHDRILARMGRESPTSRALGEDRTINLGGINAEPTDEKTDSLSLEGR